MANNNPAYVTAFWPSLGDGDGFIEVECDTGTLIDKVFTTFGLNPPINASMAGNLKGLDIKRMDALTVINLALLEGAIEDRFILELTVNADGEFEIIKIGDGNKGFSGDDIYYEMQASSYTEACVGVMITGGKPLIKRKPLEWQPIWGNTKDVQDTTMLNSNCNLPDYSTHAVITFRDPHINTDYNDGINNFYEIDDSNPWDIISGYARYIYAPGKTTDTVIEERPNANIPIVVTGEKGDFNSATLGTLQTPPTLQGVTQNVASACYAGAGEVVGSYEDGVSIPLNPNLVYDDVRGVTKSNFVKVTGVYVTGYKFDYIYSIPDSAATAVKGQATATNTVVVAQISDNINTVFKLEEGTHYSIVYEDVGEGFKHPYILFAKNTRPEEVHPFGKDTKFYLNPSCIMAQHPDFGTGELKGTVLPVAKTKGFLVETVVATVELDTPSITIYDPEFNYSGNVNTSRAKDIADNLEYMMAPIVTVDKPPPIVIRSPKLTGVIDQKLSKKDNDPTTIQDFEDTPLEKALDILDGGAGVQMTLSFIDDEDDLLELADRIYTYMNSDGADPIVTTYVCGPEAEPVLGARGDNGGIINDITYSYNDSNSYTISVSEGPWMVNNLTSVNASASFKVTEDHSARATIIEDLGNHIHYKVRIEGYEDRIAINTVPKILRQGDAVTVTVHNNPVEA